MKFLVILTALGHMTQNVEIEAPNAELAEKQTMDTAGDRKWKYQSIQENSEKALVWLVS